jgi:UDP-N-acetylmuramoylalanine-D-glutamate ligase
MAPGEALLFSPACASFDAHRNFRERALAFRAALPARQPLE